MVRRSSCGPTSTSQSSGEERTDPLQAFRLPQLWRTRIVSSSPRSVTTVSLSVLWMQDERGVDLPGGLRRLGQSPSCVFCSEGSQVFFVTTFCANTPRFIWTDPEPKRGQKAKNLGCKFSVAAELERVMMNYKIARDGTATPELILNSLSFLQQLASHSDTGQGKRRYSTPTKRSLKCRAKARSARLRLQI